MIKWVDEWVCLIDWVSEELDWLNEWVSGPVPAWYWNMIKKMDHAVWAKNLNSTRKHKLNFPQVFYFPFFLWKSADLKSDVLFLHKSIVTLASNGAGDSGAQVSRFDLSIFPTVHVSLNISAPSLLIPCPNPQY